MKDNQRILSSFERSILVCLWSFADKKGVCSPGRREIAKKICLEPSTDNLMLISTATSNLQGFGYLKKITRNKKLLYKLLEKKKAP